MVPVGDPGSLTMARLLHIEASPRRDNACSSQVAAAFLAGYRSVNAADTIDHLHLFDHALPAFDDEAAQQKMTHIAALMRGEKGIAPTGKWAAVVAEIERLKAADRVLLSTPMWNFSLPYRLKHWLDIIIQPGLTFYVNRQGNYIGLLRNKVLQIVIASGSAYADGFPRADTGIKTDFLQAYLLHVFRWIGFEDIRIIRVQPTADAAAADITRMLDARRGEAYHAGRAFGLPAPGIGHDGGMQA